MFSYQRVINKCSMTAIDNRRNLLTELMNKKNREPPDNQETMMSRRSVLILATGQQWVGYDPAMDRAGMKCLRSRDCSGAALFLTLSFSL